MLKNFPKLFVCKCHYISIWFSITIPAQVCQSHSDYLAQKTTEQTSLKDKEKVYSNLDQIQKEGKNVDI